MFALAIIFILIILACFLPFTHQGSFWRRTFIAVGSGLGLIFVTIFALFFEIFVGFDSVPSFFRRLPTDEEMIAHFYKHRSDFDRLVQIYREDLSVPVDVVGTLLPTPEVKPIMERINISYVKDDQVPWIPPDPYSTVPDVQRELTMFLIHRDEHEKRKYSGVILGYAHGQVLRLKYMGPVWKKYYYTPLVPKIGDGRLNFPVVTLLAYGNGIVVQSLNTIPPELAPFECAYRQIEPHWFIRMFQDPDRGS
jgi:hypothetical protein